MNLKIHVSKTFLCLQAFRKRRLRCTHAMHSLTFVSVVVCVVRKPRPCLSYSRRRDRINSVLWRSYYKGGGVTIGHCVRTVPMLWAHYARAVQKRPLSGGCAVTGMSVCALLRH